MKLTRLSRTKGSILIFGAHPDDIEFGCGAIVASEYLAGSKITFIVCSRGESGSFGNPKTRAKEATKAAKLLGAELQLIDLDGDAHLEIKTAHILTLAEKIRALKPAMVIAPSTTKTQHPDHYKLGEMVRDATRLERYGGVKELKALTAHKINQLLFYAVTPDAEPKDSLPLLFDVSSPKVISLWKKAMQAHASQVKSKKYVEFQLARARVLGLNSSLEYAQALYHEHSLVFNSLSQFGTSARSF